MACPNVPSPISHTHIVNSHSRNGDKEGAQEFNFRSAVLHAVKNLNISKGCFVRESLLRKSLLLKLSLSDAALQGDTAVVFAQCAAPLRNALPYYNYVDVAITEGLTKMGKDLNWRKNMMDKDSALCKEKKAQGKLKAITYANNAGSSSSGSSSSSSNPTTTAPTKSTGKGKASAPAGPPDNQTITSFLSKKGAPASHAASSSSTSSSSSSSSSMMAASSSNSAGGDSTHTDGGAKPKRKLISVEPDEE